MGAETEDLEERAAEVVAAWHREREHGLAPAPEEVVARHPDLATELREAFEAVLLLDRALDAPDAEAFAHPSPRPSPTEPCQAEQRASRDRLDRIGDYEILREIGRGGMGVVYEAEQTSMRRRVALKVLFPSVTLSPKAVERFRREAQATGRLHHTNIVQVHAMGFEDGHWFYVMELVRGRALGEILADVRCLRGSAHRPSGTSTSSALGLSTGTGRREEYARIARMFAGVAEALATAHAAGVVHRDVKPSNLMLDEDGTLKILDFGLASIQEEPSGLTRTGDLLGTPGYMSPEQVRAEATDGRTDVYSLGATLYEVLTLHPVAKGKDVGETMRQILARDPTPPRRLEPRIPRDLETIVGKALEKEPTRRYASAADLARDLRAFADGSTIAARRVGPFGRTWRLARRHPGRAAALVAVLLSLGAATWLGLLHAADTARSRERDYFLLLRRAQEAELRPGTDEDHEYSDELYAKAIALAPDRPQAYHLRALTSGTLEAREADLRQAEAHGMPRRSVLLARAYVLQVAGRIGEARAAEEEAREAGERRPDDAFVEGALALRRGDAEAAFRLFEEAVATQPRGGALRRRALGELARIHARAGRVDEALEALTSAWDTDTMPVVVALEIAVWWRRLGQAGEGEARFAKNLATFTAADRPGDWYGACAVLWDGSAWDWLLKLAEAGLEHLANDPVLVAYRAHALAGLGRPTDAVKLCRDALAAGASHELLWMALARSLRIAGELEPAVEAAREAVRASGGRTQALLDLAVPLHLLGRHAEALRALDDALALDAGEPWLHHFRGLVLCRMGQADAGIAALRRAVDLRRSDPTLVTVLADALAGAGRPEERLRVLEEASERFPLSGDFFRIRTATLLDLGRGDEAKALAKATLARIERELAVTPLRGALHASKVSILSALGRGEEAYAAAKVGTEADPSHLEVWVERGVVETNFGRLAEAEQSFQKALEMDPASVHAKLNFVPVLLQTGRFQEALDTSDEILKLPMREVQRVVASHNRACALRQLKRRDDALRGFQEVLASSPTYGHAARNLAEMHLEVGDLPAAEAWLAKVGEPLASTHAIRNLRATVHGMAGRWKESLAETEAALALAPREPMYLYNRAMTLDAMNRLPEAIDAYSRLLEAKPGDLDGLLGKARCLLGVGKPEEARAAALEAVAAAPRSAAAQEVAARAEDARGNPEAARSHYLETVALAPGDPAYANNAAWFLVTCSRPDLRDAAKAVELAEQATRALPPHAGHWNTYGYALLCKGDLEKAAAALEHSASLDGGADPSTGYFLVAALAGLGRTAQAREALVPLERWWAEHPEERQGMEAFRQEALDSLAAPGAPSQGPK